MGNVLRGDLFGRLTEESKRGKEEKKNRGRNFEKGKKTFTGEDKLYPRAFLLSVVLKKRDLMIGKVRRSG